MPDGVSCLVTGAGRPVTVFLPGLGGAADHLRPLGSGVPGTRVFCELAGNPAPHDYASLATAFRTVADEHDADQALGVSLGAGALLRMMGETPDRFSRVVIYLPSAFVTVPPARLEQLQAILRLAEAADLDALAAVLGEELPSAVRTTRPALEAIRARAERLARPEGLRLLKNLATGVAPVEGLLAAGTTEVLVIAAAGDEVHPVAVAEEIATALPDARLEVFATPAPLWDSRRELRDLVAGWLST